MLVLRKKTALKKDITKAIRYILDNHIWDKEGIALYIRSMRVSMKNNLAFTYIADNKAVYFIYLRETTPTIIEIVSLIKVCKKAPFMSLLKINYLLLQEYTYIKYSPPLLTNNKYDFIGAKYFTSDSLFKYKNNKQRHIITKPNVIREISYLFPELIEK